MSSIASLNSDAKSELHRNVADFKPSVWGNYFDQYASESMEFDQNIAAQIETRKNDVRNMLVSKIEKPLEKVHLIDSIIRLGVNYHFEDEIEDVLQHIYNDFVENGEITNFEDNLCSLAVLFRLLRQQGLYVSPTVIDDTYDAYGTIDELELFTEAIEKWDSSCLDSLPDYMKILYRTILDLYEEIEENMKNERRVYALNYYIKEFKKYIQAYMTEARWLNSNYKPTSEEYIRVSMESSGYTLVTLTCYIGMGDIAVEDIFNWISNEPKIVNAANVLCRLMDDIVSSEFEQKRGHVSSFVECYMKQYEISRQAAVQEGQRRIVDAWKDINEECLRPSEVPMPFLTRILNLSRFMDVVYKDKDNFTNTEGEMKTFIKALLVDPVPI
ncbi:(-)-germacrene D synthase [Trifolium repens]|nr:(-)-germacrene D synthase [Trifolium repens]